MHYCGCGFQPQFGLQMLRLEATALPQGPEAETSGLTSGLSAEWHVLINIAAIIAGLVVAYSVIPPKATL